MDRKRAKEVLPRFLNAVIAMAVARGPVHARLAEVAILVMAFAVEDFPEELRDKYQELRGLLLSQVVPKHAVGHPDFRKQVAAYYLSPQKARRAVDLISEILQAIVFAL
jgi:hypothetical protein